MESTSPFPSACGNAGLMPSTALPPEKLEELKKVIHGHLTSNDVYSKLREFVRNFIAEQAPDGHVEEHQLLTALHEKRVVEDLLTSVGRTVEAGVPQTSKTLDVPKGRRFLHVRLGQGKAFLDQLNEQDRFPVPQFFCYLQFGQQRFRSRPVACAVEPPFDDAFLLDITHLASEGERSLVTASDKIHLVIVHQDPKDDSQSVVGTHSFEWRKVLLTGFLASTVEISSAAQASVAAGVLEVHVELLPKPDRKLDEPILNSQLRDERVREADVERRFFGYAKTWWKEFLNIRPEHSERPVRLFSQAEEGGLRFVSAFLCPLEGGRHIMTPRHASRFVSLIPFQGSQDTAVGAQRPDQWASMHTFLAKARGGADEHALLLCSLLLGFDLDAYVVMGTDQSRQPHTWVMTRSGGTDPVMFWEPLAGTRTPCADAKAVTWQGRALDRIGCVFNHKRLYANIQRDDSVLETSFDLENRAHWMATQQDMIPSLRSQQPVPLVMMSSNATAMEEALESSLRELIAEHRHNIGQRTKFDSHLEYLLSPALAAYESERTNGIVIGNAEFQQSIKRAVPEGHTFKGFPIQFAHVNAKRMMAAFMQAPVAADILNTQSVVEAARFAVRVHVVLFPENVHAVWIMLATVYRPVS
jgi:centrosomal protein CEP76